MIQLQEFIPERSLNISNSSLSTYTQTCERKFEFRKLFHHSKRDDSEPGDVGNCLHRTHQQYLKTGSQEDAIRTLLFEYPIKYGTRPMQVRSLEACYQTALAAMQSAELARYELAYIQHNGVEKPAVEVPFRINLLTNLAKFTDEPTYPIYYIGYIDAIFYDALLNTYVILDLKTTRINAPDYSPLYKYDNQCLPYALVLEQILGHAIKRLHIKYNVWFIDALEPRILYYDFDKNEDDIIEWGQTLAQDIQRLQLNYATRYFPRRPKCYSYKKICPHFDYCDSRNMEYIEQQLAMRDEVEPPREIEPWFEIELSLEELRHAA